MNQKLNIFIFILLIVIVCEVFVFLNINKFKATNKKIAVEVPTLKKEDVIKINKNAGMVINPFHITQLENLPNKVTTDVLLTTIHKGKIVNLSSKDISTEGGKIHEELINIKNGAYWGFGFFDNSFKVMKVYDKKGDDLKEIKYNSLKIGDKVTIKNQFSLIGPCEYDECYSNIEITRL